MIPKKYNPVRYRPLLRNHISDGSFKIRFDPVSYRFFNDSYTEPNQGMKGVYS